ncbi:hypothetical protein OS187_01185 [Xanthomonadaceae bacterium JHOS43]|nr:hypothetical protein [Xanthomonadaceae bacterium JHOS43]
MPDFPDPLEEFLSESEYGCEVLDAVHGRWSGFFFGWEATPGQYRKRINAVQLFPCAMWIVLQLRYAEPDSFSSRAAGRLIDAIDHDAVPGHALIEFFGTRRQTIRNSRRWPQKAADGITHWRTACRFLRCLGALGTLPPALEGRWPLLRRALPIIDACAERFGPTRRELVNALASAWQDAGPADDMVDAPTWNRFSLLQIRRALGRRDADEQRELVLACICGAFAPSNPPPIRVTLPCGWVADELQSGDEITEENRRMRHDISDGVAEVLAGQMQLFSLRCAAGDDRITASLMPPAACAEKDEEVHVQLSGLDSEPIALPGLRAALELLEQLLPAETRIILS